MRKLTITVILSLNFFIAFGKEMEKQYQKLVNNFIANVKAKKWEELSNKISYPLRRQAPIPQIENKNDFLKRYSEVFDYILQEMIITSKPNINWNVVGSRGIMLNNGMVWLDLNGNLLAVTYQSKFEIKKQNDLIRLEKLKLHPSIQNFEKPIHTLETAKFRIRIDDLGNYNYRYASWSLKNKISDKPDLVLENGDYIPEGSGGNHKYQFKNGDYIYECEIIILGSRESPPALLTIYKGNKVILSSDAKIIKFSEPKN